MRLFKLSSLKKSRFNNLLPEILPLCNSHTFLAGGAIRSLIVEEVPSDYDFFFTNVQAAYEFSLKLIELGYHETFRCPLGSLTSYKKDDIKVQAITHRYYKDMEELLKSFDFTCTLACINGEYLMRGMHFIRDIKKKYLRIHKVTYPSSTLNRVIKYRNKGYFVHDAIREVVRLVYENNRDIVDAELVYID